MIGLVAAIGLCALALLMLVRLFVGPTLYDRALAAKALLAQGALLCAAAAVIGGDTRGVDVALALVLGALVLSVAVLKFFRAHSFQTPLARAGEDV
ncbi:MAG: hypothetical protein J0L81_07875 [Caulobacterales bacterium]|jgi:multicomponent Na+:H+ antiporter subunit F|nr:hypothetical protein [Caulobacterales bacterium]